MEGYSAKVINASKELSAREKIALKDTTNALSIPDLVEDGGKFVFSPDFYATIAVHNEKAEDTDYQKYVIVDTAGTKLVTGSESFFTAFVSIFNEMHEAGETDFEIEAYTMPSKNYKGKSFLTCSLV